MKKALSLLLCIGFMILSATGCQKTPVEPVVGNKQESVEQKVETAMPEETHTDDVSNKIQKTIDTGNEKITVTIDAEIQKPETDRLPVVKIETRNFTQEEADKIIDTLFGDRTLYQPWEKTKAEYEREIVHLKQIISDPDSTEDERGMAQSHLENVEHQYQNAPETVKKEPAVTEFVTVDPKDIVEYADGQEYTSKGDAHQTLDVWADGGTDSRSVLMIVNAYNGANSWMMYIGDVSRNFEGYIPYETAIKKEQTNSGFKLADAKISADEAMGRMGIDLEITASSMVSYLQGGGTQEDLKSAPLQAYKFYFSRNVAGVPITYDTVISGGALDEAYDMAVYYEMASITIDETGIRSFEYRAQILEENAQIIGVDEAISTFEKQMRFKYEAAGPESVFDINVHTVVLGLSRIKSGNGGLLLVPTWDLWAISCIARRNPASC